MLGGRPFPPTIDMLLRNAVHLRLFNDYCVPGPYFVAKCHIRIIRMPSVMEMLKPLNQEVRHAPKHRSG